MIHLEAQLETPAGRVARWSGSAGVVAALHVTAALLAILAWPKDPPREDERPGAIMIELPSLAAESPSEQQDVADQPLFEKSAPPPSPADQLQETPPEPSQVSEAEPVPEKAVEAAEAPPAAEPVTEPVPEELPKVEEAPLAPEPEVTLPKQQEAPKKAEPKEKPKDKVKVAERAKPKEAPAKAAQKSESKQQKQAAASAAGKFDPSPIYRAKPAYPSGARAAKIEGYVVVRYSVSPSGAVTGVSVVSASPPGVFNGATVSAVRQWRFKPSASGGSRSTTIRFKLK